VIYFRLEKYHKSEGDRDDTLVLSFKEGDVAPGKNDSWEIRIFGKMLDRLAATIREKLPAKVFDPHKARRFNPFGRFGR
jgi:hypothetical protein